MGPSSTTIKDEMKKMSQIAVPVAALAFLALTVGNLQAQVTNVITVSLTGMEQNSSSDNGTTTTTASPTKRTLATKDLLSLLAEDENMVFPTGAKLVVISEHGDDDSLHFQVLDKNSHFLADVSDIISGEGTGNFDQDVFSGKQNDATSLSTPTITDLQIFTIFYDDTGDGGSLQFYLTGLITNTITDTTPNNTTGVYKQTESHKISSGAGDGIFDGNPLVVTGSFSATGSANLTLHQ
jgi:hypothetical protein